MRLLTLLPLCAALLMIAACNQTAGPEAGAAVNTPPPAGSTQSAGALAALAEAEQTRAAHKAQSTALDVLSIFDPIGVTDLAKPVMEAEQQRVLDEKYRRVEEEIQKTVAEN